LSSPRADEDGVLPLIGEDGAVSDRVLEAFLSPGEFPGRLFYHVSEGDEASYSLDSSLAATKPFAELHPERLPWPNLAGLPLVSESPPLKLEPAGADIDDDLLDRGFVVRWLLEPLGQRFGANPHFAARVVEAEVRAREGGRRLFHWRSAPPSRICRREPGDPRQPRCDLPGIGREARALALSPDGELLALALGGLRPRIEVYDVRDEPRRVWQSQFGARSGGAVEVAFSADREWVVALTGRGRMHRFAAATGERHMSIPSTGRAATAIPPGKIMAVAGEAGEVNLWYLADGTIAWHLPPRQLRGPIDRLAASGDGERFATLEFDEDRTLVRVWQVGRRAPLAEVEVDPYAAADVALDEAGETLYVTHERQGLLVTRIGGRARSLEPSKGEEARRCRGRLRWIAGPGLLSCSVPGGELQLDRDGRVVRELETGEAASEWIVAASARGDRLAAVGGGHLFVWWLDEKGRKR
jgi:hypothetical protein